MGEIARRTVQEEFNWEPELDAFLHAITNPRIAKLLSQAEYDGSEEIWPADIASQLGDCSVTVRTEFPIAVSSAEGILNGQIDRLVLFRKGQTVVAADIIDFKTDRLARGSSEEIRSLVNRYRPQQHAYQDAISQLYHLDPAAIAVRLVFTEALQVESVN